MRENLPTGTMSKMPMAWSDIRGYCFRMSEGRETGGKDVPVRAVAVPCGRSKGEEGVVVKDLGESIDGGGRWMKVMPSSSWTFGTSAS